MANVAEYRSRPKRQRKSVQSAPRVELPPSPSITAMLARRVRVMLDDGVHWMTGYDALTIELRQRKERGDRGAASMLNVLAAYRHPAETPRGSITECATRTPEERQLADAFVRRIAEASGGETRDGIPPARSAKG